MSSNETDAKSSSYIQTHNVPQSILTDLQAGAFRSLCQHLNDRSDVVSNMDLMSISGFCRNCLAKWLVVEARSKSDALKKESVDDDAGQDRLIQVLDAMGYDEAAEIVYGTSYPDWKSRNQKKATDEQMEKFQQSKPLWAKHDKSLLQTRSEKPQPPSTPDKNSISLNDDDDGVIMLTPSKLTKDVDTLPDDTKDHHSPTTTKNNKIPLSDVCCQDVDDVAAAASGTTIPPHSTVPPPPSSNDIITSKRFVPPPPPPSSGDDTVMKLTVGVLTISDRASKGLYTTGDLSGPAVEKSLSLIVDDLNSRKQSSSSTMVVECKVVARAIVSDDMTQIQHPIQSWSTPSNNTNYCDIIFTTGGTGFASRDITPEATREILDRECPGLMPFVSGECCVGGQQQPLATLSRGTVGIMKGGTVVANLPGNPGGVEDVIRVLFPLLLYAVKDVRG